MQLFFKRIILLAAFFAGFFSFAAYANATSAWQYVGNDHFSTSYTTSDQAIAIGPDGTIYMAYADTANSSKANVMKYNGSSWEHVGSQNFSSAGSGSISMAISATGTIYVAYVDAASSSRAMVMSYNGSSWVTTGNADFSTSSIQSINIAVNPYGVPYVAFIAHGDNDLPQVMKLNGSTWQLVGTPYSAQGAAPTMVFSSTGTPYVGFSNIATGEPTVISYSGSAWYQYGGSFAYNLQGNNPIAIAPDDTLYMTVADVGVPENIETYAYSGGSWNQIGGDYTISNSGNFNLKISASGTPFVALADLSDNRVSVISYDGAAWRAVGDTKFSLPMQGSVVSLAVNSNDTSYISFSDSTASSYFISVMGGFPPPPQPRSLAATFQSASTVNLSWSAPVITDGNPVTGYKVERAPLDTEVFTTVVSNTGSTNTTYSESSVSPRVYYYRVSSVNAAGGGTPSDRATVLVPPPATGGGFALVTPSALSSGAPLTFTVNNGSSVTTNRQVSLSLNADPETVRWYAVSLDPTFAKDSLIPFVASSPATFSLPNTPGTYTVYLKYYSTTGVTSLVMQQTITYKPNASAKIGSASAAPAKSATFTRVLSVGSVGADVKALQQFLNTHGFVIAKSGVGSLGKETNYYGVLTAAAVSKFQEANAEKILIPNGFEKGTGIFGLSTRELILKMIEER